MKVTQAALRRIVREAVQRKLDEAPEKMLDVGREIGMAMVQAINDSLDVDGIVEFVSLHHEDIGRPVREEDIDHFAEQAAKVAQKELEGTLEQLAAAIMRDIMRPQ